MARKARIEYPGDWKRYKRSFEGGNCFEIGVSSSNFILFWSRSKKILDISGVVLYNSFMLKVKEIIDIKLFPRGLTKKVLGFIPGRQSIIIEGARRVGKTSLLFLIAQYFSSIGKENIYYFDLEDPDDLDIISNGPKALKKLYGKGYFLIDEFHLLNKPDKLIKLTVDHYPEIKFICSGSSSITINRKFKDSLIGRIIEIEMFPLTFKEFLTFTGKHEFLKIIPEFNVVSPSIKEIELIPDFLYKNYETYLKFGGYPEVVLARTEEEKIRILSQMFRIYAKRDLRSLFQLRKEMAFEKFFYAVAGTAGNLFKLSEIACEIGVSIKTIKEYLSILEGLFLVKVLHPFAFNVRTEIKKMPKVYFVDTGLLNWAVGNFFPHGLRPGQGNIVENAVFISLLREFSETGQIHFYHKRSGGEVDFLVSEKSIIPIEVKWQKKHKVPLSLKNFMRKHNINTGIIIVRENSELKRVGNINFYFVPAIVL